MPATIKRKNFTLKCCIQIAVTNAVFTRDRIATTFTKNKVQHTPRRIVPDVAVYVKRLARNISNANKVLSFFFKITEIDRFKCSDICFLCVDIAFIYHTVGYLIYQLKLSIM